MTREPFLPRTRLTAQHHAAMVLGRPSPHSRRRGLSPVLSIGHRLKGDMSTGEPPRRRPTRRWQRALGAVASLVVLILILIGVIPQFASYSSAWTPN